MASSCSVRVIARFRPVNEREKREAASQKTKSDFKLAHCDDQSLEIKNKGHEHKFTFDRVFNPSTAQVITFFPSFFAVPLIITSSILAFLRSCGLSISSYYSIFNHASRRMCMILLHGQSSSKCSPPGVNCDPQNMKETESAHMFMCVCVCVLCQQGGM